LEGTRGAGTFSLEQNQGTGRPMGKRKGEIKGLGKKEVKLWEYKGGKNRLP